MTTDEIIAKLLRELNSTSTDSTDLIPDISTLPYIIETDNQTLCVNSIVNGKQPSVQDRIYWFGGVNPAITTGWRNWVMLYEEDDTSPATRLL